MPLNTLELIKKEEWPIKCRFLELESQKKARSISATPSKAMLPFNDQNVYKVLHEQFHKYQAVGQGKRCVSNRRMTNPGISSEGIRKF